MQLKLALADGTSTSRNTANRTDEVSRRWTSERQT